jgi:hypothetical protein
MSILDDAIREHLELKRAHGADEAELKKLEDEAFGPPGRPEDADPFAEAPTEFLTAPATGADEAAADAARGEPSGRREPNIADLQEPPPPIPAEQPTPAEAIPVDAPEAPSEEEQPAVEQTLPVPHPEPEPSPEPEPEPEIDGGHSTEERHAIAEQPTELFDVEAELEAGSEPRSPTDEQLLDAELSEPRLAPVDPLSGIVDTGPDAEVAEEPAVEDEDDFFSEQRLSDELDQALEAPLTDEHPAVAPAEPVGPPTEEHAIVGPAEEPAAIYNLEEAEEDSGELEIEEDSGELEIEEDSGELEIDDDPPGASAAAEDLKEKDDDDAEEHEDVLEDTPDFLEDAPEDDNLWFEQKPPKDFDFDD